METRYNKVFGTGKFSLLYQVFCYISSMKKTIQNKTVDFIETGQHFYIRSLYIEFPLYVGYKLKARTFQGHFQEFHVIFFVLEALSRTRID